MNNRRTVLGLLAAAALTLCLSLPGFAPAADAAEASPARKALEVSISRVLDCIKNPDYVNPATRPPLRRQIEAVASHQDEGGMWHTLIDDPTSYLEASATSGFGCGILKAVKAGLVSEQYRENADRALAPVLDCIDDKGVVQQVSYGTPMGRESKDFYKQIPLHPMPYGQAMAILFLLEEDSES